MSFVNEYVHISAHGFRKGLSCETQLVSAIHEWEHLLNSHAQVDVILLDFAKAFDNRLLGKAVVSGADGSASW